MGSVPPRRRIQRSLGRPHAYGLDRGSCDRGDTVVCTGGHNLIFFQEKYPSKSGRPMEMATGKKIDFSDGQDRMVKIDRETGEVPMKFKLPKFI